MQYPIETPTLNAQFINRAFVDKLTGGHEKEAMEAGTAFIREKLRQEAAVREIIAPEAIAEEELDRDTDSDQPKKVIDKEPDSVATYCQFQGSGPRTWFRGKRYAIYFFKIESQRFTQSKFNLMTYTSDIRKILSDNSVKDIADIEDKYFVDMLDAIIAGNPTVQASSGPFTSATFKDAMQRMLARRRPVGKLLLTKERFMDALDLPATSVGNDVASRHFDEGIESTQKLWGIPCVTTIKGDIYDHNKAWIFSPQKPNNFLGNFLLLQDATLFIRQEADVLSFWTYEALGLGIGNTLSVQEIDFTTNS